MKRFCGLLILSFCLSFFCFKSFHAKEHALSLEDSVGQLMLIYIHGETLTPEAERCLEHIRPCGLLYYDWCNGLSTPQQVRALSCQAQSFAHKIGMPLLWIATDQEGGRVMRLRQGGYTHFPSAMTLGQAQDLNLTRSVGRAIGEELSYSGININFGPVVDIYSDADATIIGNRCFASTPEGVTAQAGAWMKGLQSAGVKACIKHFPGHGAATIDTHLHLTHVDLSKERLDSIELVPYKELTTSSFYEDSAETAYAVMTAHILVPSLDEKHIATKSPAILQQLLKEQLGFQGIVFADSLIMKAATPDDGDIVETSIDALMAGSDVLMYGGRILVGNVTRELTPEDLFHIKASLVQHAQKDAAFQARVYEAADKIVKAKSILTREMRGNWNIAEHEDLAKAVARAGVKWLQNPPKQGLSRDSAEEKQVLVAASPALIENLSEKLKGWGCSWASGDWESAKMSLDAVVEPGVLVLFSYEAWKDPLQKKLVDLATSKNWRVIMIALGTTRDAAAFKSISLMQASSSDPYSLERAYQLLTQATP